VISHHWLLLSILLFAAGLALKQPPLLAGALLFFLTMAASRLWSRFCLARLSYRRTLSRNRVFFGETVSLDLRLANSKPLPLPWVRVEDEFPGELSVEGGRLLADGGTVRLINLFTMGPYHAVTRRFTVRCRRRGDYSFGPAALYSADLFGFFKTGRIVGTAERLVVYPRVLPLASLALPPDQLFGDFRVRRHLYKDPFFSLGVRDYQPGDNPRQINWKASARLGSLQTKIFDHTTSIQLIIFLDSRTVPRPFRKINQPLLELSVVVAASLAARSLEGGYRTGLMVNEYDFGSGGYIKVPLGDRRDQLRRILEALARVRSVEKLDLGEMLLRENKRIAPGTSVAVITAALGVPLAEALSKLKQAGRKVILIVVGDAILPPGLPHYRVPADLPWEEMEEVTCL
jgi:uncharacterized protein (DUF58 family)